MIYVKKYDKLIEEHIKATMQLNTDIWKEIWHKLVEEHIKQPCN